MSLSASQKAALIFAKKYGQQMIQALNESPMFFSVMLTIGSTESGYGKSYSAVNKNNFFGILSGGKTKTFNSPKECFEYWVKILTTKDRYVNAGVTKATTPYEQIKATALGGYYDANNDEKSTLPSSLKAKYGKITPQESANWYYEKNKKMLDAILLVLPIGRISNTNATASTNILSNFSV